MTIDTKILTRLYDKVQPLVSTVVEQALEANVSSTGNSLKQGT